MIIELQTNDGAAGHFFLNPADNFVNMFRFFYKIQVIAVDDQERTLVKSVHPVFIEVVEALEVFRRDASLIFPPAFRNSLG